MDPKFLAAAAFGTLIQFCRWQQRHKNLAAQIFAQEHLRTTDNSPHMSTAFPIQSQQDAQLSQRDRAAGCIIVFPKSRRLELGDNILRTV